MTLIAFFGGIETGLIYALVALGVLISFRILDFPDLTADGSFPLGAVVFAVSVGAGVNPWLACLLGALAGAAAGTVTAWLHVSLNILPLLASILVMVALYSLNLRITGGTPNLPLIDTPSVFSPFTAPDFSNQFWIQPLIVLFFVITAKLLLDWFFNTKTGLAVRATGINARMARAQGVPTSKMIVLGMAFSNALIALGGALFAQTSGSADMSSGIGTIVIGLAAVIIGENLLPAKRIFLITLSAVLGSIVYRLMIAFALGNEQLQSIGVRPTDLNLITAVLVVFALQLPAVKRRLKRKPTADKNKQFGQPAIMPPFYLPEQERHVCRYRRQRPDPHSRTRNHRTQNRPHAIRPAQRAAAHRQERRPRAGVFGAARPEPRARAARN